LGIAVWLFFFHHVRSLGFSIIKLGFLALGVFWLFTLVVFAFATADAFHSPFLIFAFFLCEWASEASFGVDSGGRCGLLRALSIHIKLLLFWVGASRSLFRCVEGKNPRETAELMKSTNTHRRFLVVVLEGLRWRRAGIIVRKVPRNCNCDNRGSSSGEATRRDRVAKPGARLDRDASPASIHPRIMNRRRRLAASRAGLRSTAAAGAVTRNSGNCRGDSGPVRGAHVPRPP
jgi:hypothetical protein